MTSELCAADECGCDIAEMPVVFYDPAQEFDWSKATLEPGVMVPMESCPTMVRTRVPLWSDHVR